MKRRYPMIHQAPLYALSFGLAVVVAGGGASGCVEPSEDPSGSSGSGADVAPGDSHTVHRTIIRIHPDGSSDQTFEAIPVEEQQAELATRAGLVERLRSGVGGGAPHPQALETLGVDLGCASADLWLFDQNNLAGDELCLFKAANDAMAWLDLGTICRTNLCNVLRPVTWAYAVRSLWAGADPGSLQSCTSTLCNAVPFLSFSTYQKITSVAGGGLNWAFLFTP